MARQRLFRAFHGLRETGLRLTVPLLALLLVDPIGLACGEAPDDEGDSPRGDFGLLIQLASRAELTLDTSSSRPILLTGLPGIDRVHDRLGIKKGGYLFEAAPASAAEEHAVRVSGIDRLLRVEVPGSATPELALELFEECSSVLRVELDLPRELQGGPDRDPALDEQWHLAAPLDRDIDAPEAWELTEGSETTVLAVLDTGIDLSHPEFAGKALPGHDFVNEDPWPEDDHGHGTLVAGLALARGCNGIGGAGVSWHGTVLPVKVLGASGSGKVSDTIEGVLFAARAGADVLNMSYVGGYSAAEEDAIVYAHALGCVLVAAAGNQGDGRPRFPAGLDQVIAVGATDSSDRRASPFSFGGASNFGDHLDVVAPGDLLLTAQRGGGMVRFSGTSAAAPVVAGIACLLRGVDPGLDPEEVRRILRESAEDQVGRPDEDTPGFDPYHGWGRVNAFRALSRVIALDPPALDGVSPGVGSIHGGQEILLSGSGFVGDGGEHTVLFGEVAARAVVRLDGQALWVVLPEAENGPGRVDVRVVGPGGEALLDQAFEYGVPALAVECVGSAGPGEDVELEVIGWPGGASFALAGDTLRGSYEVRGQTLGLAGPTSEGFQLLWRLRDAPLDSRGRATLLFRIPEEAPAGSQFFFQGGLLLPGGGLVLSNLHTITVVLSDPE